MIVNLTRLRNSWEISTAYFLSVSCGSWRHEFREYICFLALSSLELFLTCSASWLQWVAFLYQAFPPWYFCLEPANHALKPQARQIFFFSLCCGHQVTCSTDRKADQYTILAYILIPSAQIKSLMRQYKVVERGLRYRCLTLVVLKGWLAEGLQILVNLSLLSLSLCTDNPLTSSQPYCAIINWPAISDRFFSLYFPLSCPWTFRWEKSLIFSSTHIILHYT